MQFYGQLFDLLVGLVTKQSCGTLAIYDFNEGLLLSQCLGRVYQIYYNVMDAIKQIRNSQLISTYHECKERFKNTNMLEMPFLLSFEKNRILFLKMRTLHVRGRG